MNRWASLKMMNFKPIITLFANALLSFKIHQQSMLKNASLDQQTADSRQQTADSRQQTADILKGFNTAHSSFK